MSNEHLRAIAGRAIAGRAIVGRAPGGSRQAGATVRCALLAWIVISWAGACAPSTRPDAGVVDAGLGDGGRRSPDDAGALRDGGSGDGGDDCASVAASLSRVIDENRACTAPSDCVLVARSDDLACDCTPTLLHSFAVSSGAADEAGALRARLLALDCADVLEGICDLPPAQGVDCDAQRGCVPVYPAGGCFPPPPEDDAGAPVDGGPCAAAAADLERLVEQNRACVGDDGCALLAEGEAQACACIPDLLHSFAIAVAVQGEASALRATLASEDCRSFVESMPAVCDRPPAAAAVCGAEGECRVVEGAACNAAEPGPDAGEDAGASDGGA